MSSALPLCSDLLDTHWPLATLSHAFLHPSVCPPALPRCGCPPSACCVHSSTYSRATCGAHLWLLPPSVFSALTPAICLLLAFLEPLPVVFFPPPSTPALLPPNLLPQAFPGGSPESTLSQLWERSRGAFPRPSSPSPTQPACPSSHGCLVRAQSQGLWGGWCLQRNTDVRW